MKLDETLAIRTSSGATIPLIERGAPVPSSKRETLSTSTDDQPSIRCELVTLGGGARSAAFVEVGVGKAPRGVPRALLAIDVDSDGSVQVRLDAEHGSANASFSVRVSP
jgi:molecular chaperone DnaK (HSP70)